MIMIQSLLKLFAKLWVTLTSVIGSLMVFGLMMLIVVLASSHKESLRYPTRVVHEGDDEQIAIISLSGEILAEDINNDPLAFSSGVISAKRVVALLDQVLLQDEIKAVVLRINSPGGAVVASDEIYQKVKEVNAKKPIIVSFGDVAASGGYYISSGASEIIANPATLTGSIGVIAQFPKYDELLAKVGVQMRTIKSGEFKDIGSPDREMTDSEKVIFQTMINESYDQFIGAIVKGRNMDEATVRRLADGRIYTGKQAKENGLVDELGTEALALDHAKVKAHLKNPTIIEFTGGGFLSTLLGSSLQNINPFAQVSSVLPQTRSGVYYLMSF